MAGVDAHIPASARNIFAGKDVFANMPEQLMYKHLGMASWVAIAGSAIWLVFHLGAGD